MVPDPATEIYPTAPLTYPMASDQYAVQYRLGEGAWTDAPVYISYYGGTTASPYHTFSKYPQNATSMSFASIPAQERTRVALRVTKLSGADFPAIDQVSVPPRAKRIEVESVSARTVELSTRTSHDFAGEQFVLWWEGSADQSSAIQGLAFFLNPPYDPPAGSGVKTIATASPP